VVILWTQQPRKIDHTYDGIVEQFTTDSPNVLPVVYICNSILGTSRHMDARLCGLVIGWAVIVGLISQPQWSNGYWGLDLVPDRGRSAHLWLASPRHTAQYKEVGGWRLSVWGLPWATSPTDKPYSRSNREAQPATESTATALHHHVLHRRSPLHRLLLRPTLPVRISSPPNPMATSSSSSKNSDGRSPNSSPSLPLWSSRCCTRSWFLKKCTPLIYC
jgi:hypothetical protein